MDNCYFSTANSGKGFINYNDSVYKECDYIFIIKGGPGTGKNTFLKKLNIESKRLGYNNECFLCSSDANSLDGLIIEGKVGILDGTNPHNFDIEKPGVRDNIINLGMFWDTETLHDNEMIIEDLNSKKAKMYDRLYLLLNSALNFELAELQIEEKYFNKYKAEKRIDSIINKLGQPKSRYIENIRITNGITSSGIIETSPFVCDETRIIKLNDYRLFGKFYLEIFQRKLKEKRISHTVSFDALNPNKINCIYLKGYNIIITFHNYEHSIIKRVNLSNYLTNKISNADSKEIKAFKGLKEKTMNEVLSLFKKTADTHSEIEKIYSSAMNFKKKEKYEKHKINEILSLIEP